MDHLPEVSARDLHRSLSDDKPLVLLVALCKCKRVETWIHAGDIQTHYSST